MNIITTYFKGKTGYISLLLNNNLFCEKTGDRKTSRQSKKTARQGIVNIDEINLDEVVAADDNNDVQKKKPVKKRTGPRIKNTKDKKEKKKAKEAALAAKGGRRGPKKGECFFLINKIIAM